MRKSLRLLALILVLGTAGYWVATGASRGLTKTRVPVRTVDEITGLDHIEWQATFVPGVDLLGASLAAAGLLTGASFFFRKPATGI
jgi:hypothetical protein